MRVAKSRSTAGVSFSGSTVIDSSSPKFCRPSPASILANLRHRHRARRRDRAARVRERHRHRPAAELREPHGLAGLVDQREVGHGVADPDALVGLGQDGRPGLPARPTPAVRPPAGSARIPSSGSRSRKRARRPRRASPRCGRPGAGAPIDLRIVPRPERPSSRRRCTPGTSSWATVISDFGGFTAVIDALEG